MFSEESLTSTRYVSLDTAFGGENWIAAEKFLVSPSWIDNFIVIIIREHKHNNEIMKKLFFIACKGTQSILKRVSLYLHISNYYIISKIAIKWNLRFIFIFADYVHIWNTTHIYCYQVAVEFLLIISVIVISHQNNRV